MTIGSSDGLTYENALDLRLGKPILTEEHIALMSILGI